MHLDVFLKETPLPSNILYIHLLIGWGFLTTLKLLQTSGLVAWLIGASICAPQKVVGSVPSRGTYLDCKFDPWLGTHVRETANLFLSHIYISLSVSCPLSLKKLFSNFTVI